MDNYHLKDNIQCPSILFRLNGGLYCADSRYISTIMELPEYTTLPDTPPYISGIFPLRGNSVTLFDLRTALKLQSMAEEFKDFTAMLDARKQDHIDWVTALEHSLETGERFPLTTDPHKCKLGKWYDNFKTSSSELSAHLARMEEPHRKLHEAAIRVEHCSDAGSRDDAANCQKAVFNEVRNLYMPKVLGVLEDAKEIFRTREFHEMVLVLSGDTSLGIVVDQVLSVETVEEENLGTQHQLMSYSPYIQRIVKSPGCDELILEINIPAVIRAGEDVAAHSVTTSNG
jgi:chemotaxis signal transduction protein